MHKKQIRCYRLPKSLISLVKRVSRNYFKTETDQVAATLLAGLDAVDHTNDSFFALNADLTMMRDLGAKLTMMRIDEMIKAIERSTSYSSTGGCDIGVDGYIGPDDSYWPMADENGWKKAFLNFMDDKLRAMLPCQFTQWTIRATFGTSLAQKFLSIQPELLVFMALRHGLSDDINGLLAHSTSRGLLKAMDRPGCVSVAEILRPADSFYLLRYITPEKEGASACFEGVVKRVAEIAIVKWNNEFLVGIKINALSRHKLFELIKNMRKENDDLTYSLHLVLDLDSLKNANL